MKNTCSICGAWTDVHSCLDGLVCEPCIEQVRVGRDNTTRQAKTEQRALRLKVDAMRTVAAGGTVSPDVEYEIAGADVFAMGEPKFTGPIVCGEALPLDKPDLCDTMATPGIVALDASRDRLGLLSKLGTDCTAMGLDVSHTIQAGNSLEKMLGHQLALTHKLSMDYATKAALQTDSAHSVKMLNLSLRAMQTFQCGLLTLKKLRSSGDQRITIQHVNVTDGGQAVIGQILPRGTGGKS